MGELDDALRAQQREAQARAKAQAEASAERAAVWQRAGALIDEFLDAMKDRPTDTVRKKRVVFRRVKTGLFRSEDRRETIIENVPVNGWVLLSASSGEAVVVITPSRQFLLYGRLCTGADFQPGVDGEIFLVLTMPAARPSGKNSEPTKRTLALKKSLLARLQRRP